MGTKAKGKKNELPKPKIPKSKPPPIDKLMLPAIGIGIALLAWQLMKGINSEILSVNVHDELELREVFFGEGGNTEGNTFNGKKAYANLCYKDDVDSKIPVSSVFQDAANDGTAPAEFRLVDCEYTLPDSGKTIAERFKLNLKQRPTIFVSGSAVDAPKQIPQKHLKTGNMLVKALKSLLEPKTVKIETTQDFRNKCLEHDTCAVLLKAGGKNVATPKYLKDAMMKLIPEFPSVKFVSVDSNVLYIKNLEDLIPELDENNPLHHRMVVLKKLSGSSKVNEDEKDDKKKDSGRLITSMASTNLSLNYGVMSNFIAGVIKGSETMTKLTSLPVLKSRTKKLVQEEKAKRQRRAEQQERQQQQQTHGSGGANNGGFFDQFQSNDGSKEGRKAERERRRAEHYKEHNVKPKTPEEIAEMERQRRIRMEEQAAQWNIGTEEDDPDGATEEEEEEESIDWDDVGETTVEEEEKEDEEEDDVLDLD